MVGRVPRRLFLDAGVVVEGCVLPWGASKAILVLATLREHFTVVLAEAIEREVRQAIVRRARASNPQEVDRVLRSYLERRPLPTRADVDAALPNILPVLRHQNDLDGVVSALQASADWVLSSNEVHWGLALAARTGLRVATPRAFLDYLCKQ